MKNLSKLVASVFIGSMILAFFGCKTEPVVLTSIEITSSATKTEYFVGEDLDTTGLEITAYYSDGTSTITEDWTIEGFDSSIPNDELELKVLFKGKDTSFTVKIIAIDIAKIEISKPAEKTEYFTGDELDTTGLEITAIMNNGDKQFITGWTTEFDNTVAGDNIWVKIKYAGKEVSYAVKVIALEVTKIEITNPATKTEYCIGEKLDTTGLEITVTMNNGEKQLIKGWTTEFDNTTSGNKIVTITYNKYTESYSVKVREHDFSNSIFCSFCGATKSTLSIKEFLSAIGTEVTTITADPSVPGITISEDKKTVNVYGISLTGSFTSDKTMPSSIKIADLRGINTTYIEYSFSGCRNLTSVTIPDSVTSIGSYAFNGCSSLTSVTIPDSVTSIGSYAFYKCGSLTSVTIPDSVISIGDRAFYGCSSLTSVTIPDSVTSIGSYAFNGCSSLTSVTIPDSVTSIGNSAFASCTSLTSVTIPDSVISIGEGAFSKCSNLSIVNITDINKWVQINFRDSDSNPIKYAKHLFVNGSEVTEIVLSTNVTSIGDYAFYNCQNLTSVTIPDSIILIGNYAFYNCKGLFRVTISDSVTSIGKSAFYGCATTDRSYVNITNIDKWAQIDFQDEWSNPLRNAYYFYLNGYLVTKIVLSNDVTFISKYAFYNCPRITSVTIPDSVISIGERAFYYGPTLTEVTIPDSIISVGKEAFRECNTIKKVHITDINKWAQINFQDDYSNCLRGADLYLNGSLITEIVLSDDVTSIGAYAFDSCFSITSVTIPDSVISIGKSAFNNCTSLTSVTISDSVTSIGDQAFSMCKSLTSVTIPDSVVSIGNQTFANCKNLLSVTIPDSVTSIGYRVFENCTSLTSVSIPDSVTSIGDYAFRSTGATLYYNGSATGAPWGAKEVIRDF